MEEIWKDIKGYEGLYQVSNLGRVKSLDRVVEQKNNGSYTKTLYKGKILKNHSTPNGYLNVHLSKNGKASWKLIHRLVAETFLKKTPNKNIVNHLDNNPKNNKVYNLEWTDYKGNMQYASKQGRMKAHLDCLKKAQEKRRKPVVAIKGKEILHFNSAKEAEKYGFNHRHISSCCNKKYGYKTHKGYEWRWYDGKI